MTNKILTLVTVLSASFFSCHLFATEKSPAQTAAPTSAKASVKVTAAQTKSGTVLTFSTIPGDALKINADGPWKLEIKSAKGVKPSAMEFKRDAWKENIAGFEVTAVADKGAKTADIAYKLTSFVCTTDKSMCYREVVEGKANVTL